MVTDIVLFAPIVSPVTLERARVNSLSSAKLALSVIVMSTVLGSELPAVQFNVEDTAVKSVAAFAVPSVDATDTLAAADASPVRVTVTVRVVAFSATLAVVAEKFNSPAHAAEKTICARNKARYDMGLNMYRQPIFCRLLIKAASFVRFPLRVYASVFSK
jgi:hypothetical protein